jgi:hypothetical protein
LRKLFFAVVLVAGPAWSMSGCGGSMILPLRAGAGGGLILADSQTNGHFSLGVVNGAPTLAGIGNSGTASAGVGLVDRVTGARYSLGVTNGALTLAPGSSGSAGVEEIGLVDSATAKSYELEVVGGALTLIQG